MPQNTHLIKQLDLLYQYFKSEEGQKPPADSCDTPEKQEAYQSVCLNLPKYLQTLQFEMAPGGHAKVAVGMAGDPASYRAFLMQALAKLVPPIDVEQIKPVDRQKEAELQALPGTLVLGVNLLTDLGSGEQQILN